MERTDRRRRVGQRLGGRAHLGDLRRQALLLHLDQLQLRQLVRLQLLNRVRRALRGTANMRVMSRQRSSPSATQGVYTCYVSHANVANDDADADIIAWSNQQGVLTAALTTTTPEVGS